MARPEQLAILLVVVLVTGCGPERAPVTVRPGAEVMAKNEFERLAGKQVGVIVNHTARVDTTHLVDMIKASDDVELGAIFAPEHGIRGEAGAGTRIEGRRDTRTGTPVYSLYDETRTPTGEEMRGLDALVFDVQAVGARFYTYITTMGLAMQSAADAGLPFFVLDRPNPLGGTYVSGYVLEAEHESFVGRYPIPIVYGMTIGELARYIHGEDLLPGVGTLDLSVVPVQNWERTMQWPDTGLPWRPPSPNLPSWETALLYPGMCFFEGVRVSEGRGTERPFLQIGAPWSVEDARHVVETLRREQLSGVRFDTTTFVPRARPGAAPSPRFEDTRVYGFEVQVTNREAVDPLRVGIHALSAMYGQAQERGATNFISRPGHLTRLAGTDRLAMLLEAGVSPDSIVASWREEVRDFRGGREPYLLY